MSNSYERKMLLEYAKVRNLANLDDAEGRNDTQNASLKNVV